MDQGQIIEAAWMQLRLADDAQAEDQRRAHLARAIDLLERAVSVEATAASLYALGYAWYQHPDLGTSPAVRSASVDALRGAVRADSRHALAHLYLGHNAYDQGENAEALREFGHAAGGLDEYLEAKRREAVVCCNIRIHGLAASLVELGGFATWLEGQTIYDIHPGNLAKALREAHSELASLRPDEKRTLAEIAARLDRAGRFRAWFAGIVRSSGSDPSG
jgi:tetratricopeptide (TPR) repeat protein